MTAGQCSGVPIVGRRGARGRHRHSEGTHSAARPRSGSVVGSQGARYAGTRARNLARDPDEAAQALEQRHMEVAEQMVETLGRMKGAAMKIGQLASFIDTEFLPPEYRDLYQDKLATLRSTAPPMPWKQGARRCSTRSGTSRSRSCSRTSTTTPRRPHRSARCTGPCCPTAGAVAVKVQYPGVASAIAADMQNAGLILRLAKAFAPGLDAKAAAAELKERVMEELDYELEAQNQRAFARGYRGHPFIHVPGRGHAAVDGAGARERVGRRRRLRRGARAAAGRSATASARSCSASASARSTTSSTSTPTPTPGTTWRCRTGAWRSSTSE